MTEPGIRVEGARELRRTAKKAGQDLGDLKAAHGQAGAIVSGAARIAAPVRTGRLAASVRASGTNTAAIVRAGKAAVPYANPIHWGWPGRRIEAQPFISTAAKATEPQWINVYEDAVQRIVDRIKGA